MPHPRYPSLYQINTRVWLTEIGESLGRPATLDDIPDAELDRFKTMGFDWIWMLSVWQTGLAARRVSRTDPQWRQDFVNTLPNLKDDDIGGSGFAITGYTVHTNLGGAPALARLRERLKSRGIRLMLDFVPNHMGLDHPWIESHPDYFINGTEADLKRQPQNYTIVRRSHGDAIMAYGRDPYFSGWPDTLQLNYGNPATQTAMLGELLQIADQCDGVRCDMAMLVLPEVFARTWGISAPPFWPKAIAGIRQKHPEFCFLAEVYWEMEWTLQQQGFNYAYDKRLYDRLHTGFIRPVREHLFAGLEFQDKLARFLENHDEPRAAATFRPGAHEVAALVTYLSPGMRFFHQGQFEGHTKRISPHLVRGPKEPTNPDIQHFYEQLLTLLKRPVFRDGNWQLLNCASAWDDNWTWDCFIAFAWTGSQGEQWIVVVNGVPHQSQCRLRLPFPNMEGKTVCVLDALSQKKTEREGGELMWRGLYLDLPAWGYQILQVSNC